MIFRSLPWLTAELRHLTSWITPFASRKCFSASVSCDFGTKDTDRGEQPVGPQALPVARFAGGASRFRPFWPESSYLGPLLNDQSKGMK